MATYPKATDGGRVYFSRRQLFIVATLFCIASAVIFFLGILIGQSIEERKLLRREEPAVSLPVESGGPKADQEMTFYETLTKKPEPVSPPQKVEKPAEGAAPQTPWTVQVVASRSRTTADKIVAALKKQGYKAYVTSIKHNKRTFYRVRVGAYQSRRAAQAALDRLKARYENAEIQRN